MQIKTEVQIVLVGLPHLAQVIFFSRLSDCDETLRVVTIILKDAMEIYENTNRFAHFLMEGGWRGRSEILLLTVLTIVFAIYFYLLAKTNFADIYDESSHTFRK